MKSIHRWTGAVLTAVLGGSVALGQMPPSLPGPTGSGPPPLVTVTTEPLPPVGKVGNWSETAPGLSSGTPGMLSLPPRMPQSILLPGSATLPANNYGPPPGPPLLPAVAQPSPVESWLNYNQPGCCGPTGGNGPIGYDLYVRIGPSIPLGGGPLQDAINVGWDMRFGAKTLFFTPSGGGAWYVDNFLSYTYNGGDASKQINVFGLRTTVRDYHRWNFGTGLGKEWYTNGPGFVSWAGNWNCAYGFDAGGRWGTSHINLNVLDDPRRFGRRHDVIGGAYAGFNLDYEVPMGSWTFVTGARTEFAVNFTDILPGTSGTLFDLNFLLSAGVRY